MTLLVDGNVALKDVQEGLARLNQGDVHVTVRIQRADPPLLNALVAGGARAIEWTVRAPTTTAALAWRADPQEALDLHAAIREAGALGLEVRLRWRVAGRTVAALTDLSELHGLAPVVDVIALPSLEPGETPALDAVSAAWPKTLPPNVRLLRSRLWPSCLPGEDVEPATSAEQAHAAPQHVHACDDCPLRARAGDPQGCAGVPAAIVQRPEGPGPAWQAWQRLPNAQKADENAHVDPDCAEARGLALGLRRAWRLFLPARDVAAYTAAFAPRGWHVTSGSSVRAAIGGQIHADGDGDHVLTVVALTAEDAETCLQGELANLERHPTLPIDEQRAHWQAITATHRQLGTLYGYPPCCIEAFLDAHGEIVEHIRQTDNAIAILRAALRTRHFDARLASLPGLLGEEARTPLRHLPCRFDCPASSALADTLLADLAVHNPAWTARQRSYCAEPILLFADGTVVSLQANPVSRDEVDAVQSLVARPSQIAGSALVARLQTLQEMTDLEAIRVVPGQGLALRRHGVWQDWPLPPQDEPRAQEFPILLPFTLDQV